MDFSILLNDKSLKAKAKTQLLSQWLLANPQKADELVDYARSAKGAVKATCIEAFEFATKSKPDIASPACLDFMSKSLTDKAPRVKWESAKVIGNIASLYPGQLDEAIHHLFENAEHPGTVVRWSAAFALGEILKLKTARNVELIPAVESVCGLEEKNSIKKIYLDALKKIKK